MFHHVCVFCLYFLTAHILSVFICRSMLENVGERRKIRKKYIFFSLISEGGKWSTYESWFLYDLFTHFFLHLLWFDSQDWLQKYGVRNWVYVPFEKINEVFSRNRKLTSWVTECICKKIVRNMIFFAFIYRNLYFFLI